LCKDIDIVNDVKLRRLQWARHVIRMPEERIPRKVMMGKMEGLRPIGRPRKRWMDGVRTDAKGLLKVKNWKAQALDRNEWRHIIGKAKARFELQRHGKLFFFYIFLSLVMVKF
jgi:hypothetical protein